MFFSVNDLYNYGQQNEYIREAVSSFHGLSEWLRPSKKHYAEYVRTVKAGILNRDLEVETPADAGRYIGKWHRPWDVVPSLANFAAPAGDYAVGVEIELGFTSKPAARQVAAHIQHWKHVALDYEGGNNPIEATFPPVLYSKFGAKSQPSRYLKWLTKNAGLVTPHREDSLVGTHVNVSKGYSRDDNFRPTILTHNLQTINSVMERELSTAERRKYFGRAYPYRYGRSEGGKFIEFKMFNSTTDWKSLRRYVDIAVELAALAYGDLSYTRLATSQVREALERGYNKRNKAAKVSSRQAQSDEALLQALAA